MIPENRRITTGGADRWVEEKIPLCQRLTNDWGSGRVG